MKDIAPAEPVVRYEYAKVGGMIHLDMKRLGRLNCGSHRITGDRKGQSNAHGFGLEYGGVCIDDASCITFTDILPDEKAVTAIAFLKAAIAYYASRGVTITRVMTDNGKAKHFIQTALREWATA